MFSSPFSPVGHSQKTALSERVTVPSQEMLKLPAGVAPSSHWNCEVGGVRMQPRPLQAGVSPEV